MFPSYRNQSVYLQNKSTDWCLYGGNIGRSRVNISQIKSTKTKDMEVLQFLLSSDLCEAFCAGSIGPKQIFDSSFVGHKCSICNDFDSILRSCFLSNRK